MSGIAFDAASLALASACAAALLVVWLSIVASLRKRASGRAALLSLLVLPAPPLAWRAGLRARAIAMPVLAIAYAVIRIVSR